MPSLLPVWTGSRWVKAAVLGTATLATTALITAARSDADERNVEELTFVNPSGLHRTLSTNGAIDESNPFFQDLGTNGRSCFTCHRPAQAWTITPGELQERFAETRGLDPIFRTNDGSNCEDADVSTLSKRRTAFSQLLDKGLIRVGLRVPAHTEFEVVGVDDPYRCGGPLDEVSMYRRPLPTTNLTFTSAVMWDGRETVKGHAIATDLATQTDSATIGHAEGGALSPGQRRSIVDFETGLFTAQTQSRDAGSLLANGAMGGPRALSNQWFCIGINDPLGMLPAMPGACPAVSPGLDTSVFTVFEAWGESNRPARRAIARGETIFNTRTFTIDNVSGLNGDVADPVGGPIVGGTCTVCHNTPNAGNHSVAMPLNIGIADASRRTSNLPLYTLQNKATLETVQTTDPGRAMVTGKWRDIGRFKGPILRALAPRAPYFHNGSATTLGEAVDFYDHRFNIGFSAQEKADLVAFLSSL